LPKDFRFETAAARIRRHGKAVAGQAKARDLIVITRNMGRIRARAGAAYRGLADVMNLTVPNWFSECAAVRPRHSSKWREQTPVAESEAKRKLVRFLEEKAFRPILKADASRYPKNKREQLKDVQRRTEGEIERFRNYGSAQDVVTNFRRDLSSDPAKKVHRELDDLGLPTLNDVRAEFEKLAEQLGVR
jgi:hypothetical protein